VGARVLMMARPFVILHLVADDDDVAPPSGCLTPLPISSMRLFYITK